MQTRTISNRTIEIANNLSRMTTTITEHEAHYEMYKDWVEQSQIAFERTNDESHLGDIERYIRKRDDAKQALDSAVQQWNQLIQNSVLNCQ